MTDLDEVNHYLGMRVRRNYTRRVIYLVQESYVNDILERFSMQDCKPVNTPMDQTKLEPYKVENTKTSPNPQEGEYREIVGSLMYLMICTRPDIVVAVRALKRQPTVALSMTKAEYMAFSFATQETIWLRSLLQEVQIHEYLDEMAQPTTIYEDNESCILLAMNPVHHPRTKHIDIRHHFICDHVDKEIHLEYLPTAEMVADSLMRPLPSPASKYHRKNMCIKHYDNIVTPMTRASMTELPNE
ncbi:DNA-directed DNA polymerase [Powellomyces hirtus]|uniref:DNA-directed DNA polymerase n=1 Tax=Powellomyces hirtus TaxID=109895 RepID=A0A507DN69_9FUNG|nr:DNA-directed DNA polymerase [Powellomyces hirtus]